MGLRIRIELFSFFLLFVLALVTIFFDTRAISARLQVNAFETQIDHFSSKPIYFLPFETITTTEFAFRKRELNTLSETHLVAFINLVVHDYLRNHTRLRRTCERNRTLASMTPLLVYRGDISNYGIGDRIRGLLNAFLIASMSRRLLLIDLPVPFPLNAALTNPPGVNFTYDPSIFPFDEGNESFVPNDVQVLGEFDLRLEFSRCQTSARVLLQRSMPLLIIDKLLRSSALFPDFHVDRERAGLAQFEPLRDELAPFLLQAMVRPSRQIRERFLSEIPFNNNRFISLHARLGWGVSEMNQRFNGTDYGLHLDDIGECIGRIAGRVAKTRNISNVFIATDTREANFSIEQGIRKIIPNAEVLLAPGQAVHLRRMHGRSVNENDKESFMTVFQDLMLLAAGESLVYFPSGFADFALWLGAITDGQKITMSDCKREHSIFSI